MSRKEAKDSILIRTRNLREKVFDDQKDMAAALGIEYGTYNKYETRSVLPHDLIAKFCNLTEVSVEYFLTGRENPIIAAYNALPESDRPIVDRFLFGEKHKG